MPYKTRKVKGKGTCVYKKDSGKKVGCTTGPIKKYLAALHMNEVIREEIEDFEWIKDQNPLDEVFSGYIFIDNDIDDDSMVEIQKALIKYGYYWMTETEGHGQVFIPRDEYFLRMHAISTDTNIPKEMGYYSHNEESDDGINYYEKDKNEAKSENRYFKASDIQRLINNNITESEEFDWIKQSEPPKRIESGSHSSGEWDVIRKYFKDNRWSFKYKGWEIYLTPHSGTVEWSHPQIVQTLYYATPYWDGRSEVPIDFTTWFGEEEVYEGVGLVEIPKFEYEWELLDWMDTQYFDLVHQQIMEHAGPLPE
jgi:hypothetical protein